MHSSYPEPKNNGVNSTEIAKIPHAIAEETATISSIDNKNSFFASFINPLLFKAVIRGNITVPIPISIPIGILMILSAL